MTDRKSSPNGIQTRPFAYENFMGLDSSRPLTAQDSGKNQTLAELNNGYCDWRGQIVRDGVAVHRGGDKVVRHVRFYQRGKAVWAEQYANAIALDTDDEHRHENAFPNGAVVTSAVFNKRVLMFARDSIPLRYTGTLWEELISPSLREIKPAFATSIQRRLAVAGLPGQGTRVLLSRVDNEDIMPDDESPTEESVLRASYIDIANLLNTADAITGLGVFEQNRLAIFTEDRVLVYFIDPDVDNWQIDPNANINVGCLSHNTIVRAGTDLLFCSRSGVHSIIRSQDNGITVFSQVMSENIEETYRKLVASVADPRDISAVFDQDKNQYHVYFPQPGGVLCKRLTVTLSANPDIPPKWSSGDFLNARCGDFLGGQMVVGTSGGTYTIYRPDDEPPADSVGPDMTVATPVFWCGSMQDIKSGHSVIIQAHGSGSVEVLAVNELGVKMLSWSFEVDDQPDDNNYIDVPLSRQYERSLPMRFRGIQLRFTFKGKGLLRVVGLAVTVKQG